MEHGAWSMEHGAQGQENLNLSALLRLNELK